MSAVMLNLETLKMPKHLTAAASRKKTSFEKKNQIEKLAMDVRPGFV
jgi:hypothetical protein